jgi:thiol:disulfide interchange protein DsbC
MAYTSSIRQFVLVVLAAICSGCGGSELIDPATVKVQLQAAYPGASIEVVKPTPMKGLFEVNLGGRVMYSDASGRYVLFGRMHDMQSEEAQAVAGNLPASSDDTTVSSRQAVTELVKAADRNAIKYVKGNGATALYLFTDPKCPYCRPTETELEKLDNVTIYKFMYPILSDESRTISTKVWCSSDRLAAWKRVMTGGGIQGPGGCATPLDANISLAKALGIRGTPTLLNSQGRMLVGFQSADSVAQLITTAGGSK